MTLADALSALKRMVASTAQPLISDDDLTAILIRYQRATGWVASTSYSVNDKIYPTVANGHYYVCTSSGTSGSTEPVWPIPRPVAIINQPYSSSSLSLFVSDGTAQWSEYGPAYDQPWDLSGAAHEAWLEKAALVAHLFDFKDDVEQVGLSQRYDHCLQMAQRYAPRFVV